MITSSPTIVGLGEALWDVFPDGSRFGGAPANFTCHAAMLGANTYLLSAVGNDAPGDQAIASLQACGVRTDLVQRNRFPTGRVQVTLDAQGVPSYEIRENVAWDHLVVSEELLSLVATVDCICFGTLGQRSEESRTTIQRFVTATGPKCLRILDINFRQHYFDRTTVIDSLQLANALKLNDEELPTLFSLLGSNKGAENLQDLLQRYSLQLIALTSGAKGARLLSTMESVECQAPVVVVKDTVGAGDAFTAALALGWLRGHDLTRIGNYACRVAAYVCTQPGATPMLPRELIEERAPVNGGFSVA